MKRFKLFALVLTVIFTICNITISGVSANGYYFDMEQLGITEGINFDEEKSEYVARDEFAQMVVNMMQQQDVAKSLENATYFTDIANSKYKGAINLLAQMGYISGSGTGVYAPNDYISYGAACKILVHALGYDVLLEENSLSEYQYIAGNINLTDGINFSKPFLTVSQAMCMINNALDIGMMVPMYYNANIAPSYEIDESRTYRSMLYGRNGTGIVKMRGMVTADVSCYLYKSRPNMKNNQIEIEGKVYNYDGVAPLGYVGQIVDYYITVEDYAEGVIKSISPTTDNDVYDFGGSFVTKASTSGMEFWVDSTKYVLKTDNSTRYIYNNRIDNSYKMSMDKINDNMVIRTVNNDDDDIINFVYIYDYANVVVDNVYEESKTIVLKDGYTLGKEKNIQLDDENIYYEIYDMQGRIVDFSAIESGVVLSIARSTDKKNIRMVVFSKTETGTISGKSGDELILDDNTYMCAETIDFNDLKIGTHVTAYFNFLGKIVMFTETKFENNYAYVYQYNSRSGIDSNYSVKLLLPAFVSIKKVEGAVDEMSGEVSTSQSLFVRNDDVVIYKTPSKIIFNGKKQNAKVVLERVIDSPIAYTLNEKGELYKIDTLTGADDIKIDSDPVNGTKLMNKTYNGTELIFGKKGAAFAIKKDYTLAFCVPKYQESGQTKDNLSDDDLKVIVELMNNVAYEANGYEVDDDTCIANVLVVQQIMQSGQAGSVLNTSDVGIVTRVVKKLSEDGEEINAVAMITEDGEKTINVSPLVPNQSSFVTLKPGDLISYTLDGYDLLNAVKVLQSVNDYYEFQETSGVCANIKDIEYNRVSVNRVRWVHNVYLGYDDDDTIIQKLELLVRNTAPIFVMESEKNIRLGSIEDLQIGDTVFASLNLGNVRAIVIKK